MLTVQPAGIRIHVAPQETLLQAAWRAGYDWPTLCYGQGTCTACQCEVIDGLHHLSPRTEAEVTMLGDLSRRVRRTNPQRVRLACQATTQGDLIVRKAGVKQSDPNGGSTHVS